MLTAPLRTPAQNDFEIGKNLDIFANVIKSLHLKYIDEINANDLTQAAIKGMLDELDPYTVFYSETEIEDVKIMTKGQYGGVGALIQQDGEYVVVSEPYENSPAHRAGLQAGDRIIAVNGKDMKNKTTEDVSNLMKGQPGTVVKLTIIPYGETKSEVKEITRQEIQLDNIPYYGKLGNGTGYIKLTQFSENAAGKVKDAFKDLKKQGISSLIIDLRNNGGGLLTEAVDIVNLFVPKGQLVVETKGKLYDSNNKYLTRHDPVDTQIPVVILINEHSASASEIVAGSIQDFDRGILIGQRSFGKGIVQNIVPLSYNTRMKITISKYYIPSGRCIQAIDYSDKDSSHKAKRLADSLAVAFQTKNGRTVYDKGGVEPDIKIEPDKVGNVVISLLINHHIFNFANEFRKKNPNIAPAANFAVTDDIFNDFLAYIKDKNYEYQTESEKIIEKLTETAKEEKYYEAIKDELDRMKNQLAHDKTADIVKFKKQIVEMLQAEIVTRYYFERGAIENALPNDPEIQRALQLFANQNEYQQLLKK